MILLLFLVSQITFADNKVDLLLRQYDDGETQVTSPHANVSTSISGETVHLGVGYAMDIVTSSSCDVRSWSSQGRITDSRKEISASAGIELEKGAVNLGYIQSEENDYTSHAFSISSNKAFFEKNTVVDVSLATGVDHIKSSYDKQFDGVMKHATMSLGITQVLSKVSLMQLLYDFRTESGYLASPYRVARVSLTNGSVIGYPEVHPLTRNRHTTAFRYNYFMKSLDLALASTLRFYMDSWGVKSGTIEERISREFFKGLSISLVARYYKQLEATFYKDKYEGTNPGAFVTGNKTLSRYSTMLVGVRPTYSLGSWNFFLKYEYYKINYENFTDVGVPSDVNDDKMYETKAQIIGFGLGGTF